MLAACWSRRVAALGIKCYGKVRSPPLIINGAFRALKASFGKAEKRAPNLLVESGNQTSQNPPESCGNRHNVLVHDTICNVRTFRLGTSLYDLSALWIALLLANRALRSASLNILSCYLTKSTRSPFRHGPVSQARKSELPSKKNKGTRLLLAPPSEETAVTCGRSDIMCRGVAVTQGAAWPRYIWRSGCVTRIRLGSWRGGAVQSNTQSNACGRLGIRGSSS
jgi:hypothetical protein